MTNFEKKVLKFVKYWVQSSDAPISNEQIAKRFGVTGNQIKTVRDTYKEREELWVAQALDSG